MYPRPNKKTYQIIFAQAFAKVKQYQTRLWQLRGSPLSQFFKRFDVTDDAVQREGATRSVLSRKSLQAQQVQVLDALQMYIVINGFCLTYRHCVCAVFSNPASVVFDANAPQSFNGMREAIGRIGQVTIDLTMLDAGDDKLLTGALADSPHRFAMKGKFHLSYP